jgi:hypothetical protein
MLIIGGIVAAFAVFNGVYPAIGRSNEAIIRASDSINDQIKSQIEIIQVNGNGTTVNAWIKNVGNTEIVKIENGDIFFGINGNIVRISYGDNSSSLPYWDYQLEGNHSAWTQTVTGKITIHMESSLTTGTYLLKVILPNGITSETSFGVE